MKPLRRLVQVFAPIDKEMMNDLAEFRLMIIAKGQIKGESMKICAENRKR